MLIKGVLKKKMSRVVCFSFRHFSGCFFGDEKRALLTLVKVVGES